MRPQFISAVVVLVSCAVATNGAGPKFEVGKSYTFDYSSEIRANSKGIWSHLTAAEIAEVLTVETKAQVILHGLSETEYLLMFNDGELKTRTFTKEAQVGPPTSIKMENSVTKFTFVDGLVTSTLSNPDEPVWSVNIKRGVVSLLQNKAFSSSMDKAGGIEESVLGQCVTKYDLPTPEYANEYRKEINLNECGRSEGSEVISQGVPYQIPLVTNKPLLGFLRPSGSVMECRQSVSKELVLTSSVCTEGSSHSILNHNQQSSLTFISSSDAPADADVSKLTSMSSSLLYDFESTTSPTAELEKIAVEKLQVLLGNEHFDMNSKDELEFFNDFKVLLPQVSDLTVLKELLEKSPRKKVFYDAAAEVVTDSAISLLVQADKAKELDLITRMSFYGSLSFVSQPGVKALEALTELVKEVKLPILAPPETKEMLQHFAKDVSMAQHLLLGVSGAAYRFCSKMGASCASSAQHAELVNAIVAHVNEEPKEMGEDDLTLAALFALGNVNSLTPEAAKKLEAMINSETISVPLRLAAMDAFRRDPCQRQLKDLTRSKLVDKTGTDELRIHAYLATVKCLTEDDISAVKGVLDETENNLVKGFIASHIKNFMASTSPSTAGMRASLSAIEVPASTSSIQDIPRASKFVEHSTFRQKENVGFSGSMTVFFAPGQTCPQFVSFNKTLDVFGRSYNFIEVGLSHRMVPTDRAFHGESEPPNWMAMHRALEAKDSYIRVFGTTVAMGMEGLHKAMQLAFFKISNGTILMDLIQPATLLDEKLSISTVTGLPVTFGLNAAYLKALQLEMTAEPLQKLMTSLFALTPEDGKDIDLKLNMKLHASGSGRASASVGGDSPVRVGYVVEAKMNKKYSWGIEAMSARKSADESSVALKLNFPDKTIASKNVKGRVYSFQEINGVSTAALEGSTAVSVPPKMYWRINSKCDSCQVFGIRSCANVTRPEQRRMFPFSVAVSISKLDETATGIVLSASTKRSTDSDGNLQELQILSLSTPGSSSPREIKATLITVNKPGNDFNGWTSYELDVAAALNKNKFDGVLKMNKSFTPSLYLGIGQNSNPVESIVDIKTALSGGGVTVDGKFGGPLTFVAEEFKVATEYQSDFTDRANGFAKRNLTATLRSKRLHNPSLKAEFKEIRTIDGDRLKDHLRINQGLYKVDVAFGMEAMQMTIESNRTFMYKFVSRGDESYSARVAERRQASVRGTTFKEEIERDLGQVSVELGTADMNFNASVTVDSKQIAQYPVKAEIEVDTRPTGGEINGTMQVAPVVQQTTKDYFGKVKFDAKAPGTLNVDGDIPGISDFKGSASVAFPSENSQKAHIHMDVNILPAETSVSVDVDVADDGNIVNEQTSAIVKTKGGEHSLTANSTTIVNRAERSYKHQEVMSDEKGQVVYSLSMDGQAQPCFKSSGVSRFAWDYHDAKGHVCQGTINKTVTAAAPIWKSLVEGEVIAGHGPNKPHPIKFVKEVTFDSTADPDSALQGHVSVQEKVASDFLNLHASKEISWKVKKLTANFNSDVNMTLNGEMSRTSFGAEWNGDKDDVNKGEIKMVGTLKDARHLGEGDLKVSYDGDMKKLQTVRAEGEITSTKVETSEKTELMALNMTRTIQVPHWPLMSLAERGSVKLPTLQTEYLWTEEISVQRRDFVFHRDVKVLRNGVEKFEEEVLIHLSVHLRDDEHQQRLTVRTDHNFALSKPNCPLRRMNFTLSR